MKGNTMKDDPYLYQIKRGNTNYKEYHCKIVAATPKKGDEE